MSRARGFTVLELVIASAVLAGVVALALAWLPAQQRFAAATSAHLEAATREPPLVVLLRQDVQAAGGVLPAWQGMATDETTLILALPQDAYGYRTDRVSIVVYSPSGNRLLRAAFPDLAAGPAGGGARFIGPDLRPGAGIRFVYLDAEGMELAGEAIAGTRVVVAALPASPGRPPPELRVPLGNALP